MRSIILLQMGAVVAGVVLLYLLLKKLVGTQRANFIVAGMVLLGLPLTGFYLTKNYTSDNVYMPRKYFIDSVVELEVAGKKQTDTLFHKVKNLRMVNQYGDTVTMDSLRNKVLLVNFFFTHCPTICPGITTNLKKVQTSILKDTAMHIISITIDPKRDTVPVLRTYASRYNINHDNWWLCRIVDDTLENVMLKEFKSGFQSDSIIEIVHSPHVYLLDKKRIVRGKPMSNVITEANPKNSMFYDGRDSTDMIKLIEDAGLVKMEKIVKNKPPFALLITSMVIMGLVFVAMLVRSRNKKVVSK